MFALLPGQFAAKHSAKVCLPACCLQAVVAALPDLTETVQVQLLDLLALVLTRKPYRTTLSSGSLSALREAMQLGEATKPKVCSKMTSAGGDASRGFCCRVNTQATNL